MTEGGWGTSWPVAAATNVLERDTGITSEMSGVRPDKQLQKQGSNLVDDEGQLYFQCNGCGALFDPATKSFKKLHDFAHKQGWKLKWNINGLGYAIYCPKCGD